jgi:hypothetical protein
MALKLFASRSSLPRSLTLWIAAVALFSSGCVTRKTVIPLDQRLLPAQSSTFKDLLHELADRSRAIKTLTAKRVLFQPSAGNQKKGEITQVLVCTAGLIIVDRPNDDIRIHLNSIAGITCADLVSNGKEYKVSSPVNNKFYEGNANEPIAIPKMALQLPPPQEIANALFVDITPFLDNPQRYKATIAETTAGQRSYYVLGFIDVQSSEIEAQLVREIWIDRTDMSISRQITYGPNGRLETNTQFSGYQISGDVPFPKVVSIQRPIEDVNLKITFQADSKDTEINAPTPAGAFQLPQPPGSELVQVPGVGVKPQEQR